MLGMAREIATHDSAFDDLGVKFMEHFALISEAMRTKDLWDEEDGFYYDMLRGSDGHNVQLRVRSMVGIIPLFATKVVREEDLASAVAMRKGFAAVAQRRGIDEADARARRWARKQGRIGHEATPIRGAGAPCRTGLAADARVRVVERTRADARAMPSGRTCWFRGMQRLPDRSATAPHRPRTRAAQ